MIQTQSDRKTYLYLLLFIVLAMLSLTNSTPLRNLSYTDSSVFITMGRAILNGKIVYKEVFDHKGIYIYFINALAALISSKSLLGLWLIEILFMFVNAIIVIKIYQQFTQGEGGGLASQLTVLSILYPVIFEGGNLTETYTLTFQFLSIYLLTKYLKSGQIKHSPSMMFIHGLNAAFALNLRPNHVMMWIPIALLLTVRLLHHREFKNLAQNFFAGFAGLLTGCLPIIIYAVINDAVYDILFGTFLYNFLYVDTDKTSFFMKFILTMSTTQHVMILFVLFLSCVIVWKNLDNYSKIYYFSMLFFSATAISLSGKRFGHYYIYLVPFMLPVIFKLSNVVSLHKLAGKFQVIMLSFLIFHAILMSKFTIYHVIFQHRYENLYNQVIELYKNYHSKDISNEEVLVTGNNARFYVNLGLIPQEKYFYIPANPYEVFPEATDSQILSILSGKNNLIIWDNNSEMFFAPSGKLTELQSFLITQYDILLQDNGTIFYVKKK